MELIKKLTPKQRIEAMLAVGVLLGGLLYYNNDEPIALPKAVPMSIEKPLVANTISSQPVMPTGYQANASTRDPFSVPIEYQPKNIVTNKSELPNQNNPAKLTASTNTNQQEILPVLVGVVRGNNDTQMAIIKYGNESRSYRVRDSIGPYQLVAINNSAATLSGPSGKLVLALGR